MSADRSFYLAQADACEQAADEADLQNLKDKYLRSRDAWQALANRELTIQAAREKRLAARQAELLAAE